MKQNITTLRNNLAVASRQLDRATLNGDLGAIQVLTTQTTILRNSLRQAVENQQTLQRNRELIRNDKWKYLCGQAVKLFL